MGLKKDPVFRDMVRVASSIRSENGKFLKDDSGEMTRYARGQFKKFSFLKEASIRRTFENYLNNIDRGN